MPKLTDCQLVILSGAAQREDGAVLPLLRSLKVKGTAGLRLMRNQEKLWTPNPADRDGRRIWPENLGFVRLPAPVVGNVPAKRPGTAAFPSRAFMDPGLLESGWWSGGESNP